jgi:hypothetical protein
VFDFFAGTRSSTQAFEDIGDRVISFDNDQQFEVTEVVDIFDLSAHDLIARYGRPDFVWASPPCTAFSVASMGHHWERSRVPKTNAARLSIELVAKTRALIEELNPRLGFVIENPRGILRKLAVLEDLPRKTVTYCQYGDTRMKPTDLWTNIAWEPRPMCKNGAPCHEAAPRGARTGTQGRDGAVIRSMVPYELGNEIRKIITSD